MEISKLKALLYERWRFYAVGYVFGYIFSIIYIGVSNTYYLIPIKLSCIIFAILLGTAFYYGSKKMRVFDITIRIIKYCILAGLLIIITTILQSFMKKNGIDITPFIGL